MHNGAVPVLIPRVPPTAALLESYYPFDGLLLVEGEDVGPAYHPTQTTLPTSTRSALLDAHPADAHPDHEKDAIEFALVHHAFAHAVPILAICRGSQILNVAAGGTLIPDIDLCVTSDTPHIDYNNYDQHRHPIHIRPSTPLSQWFDHAPTVNVNSYHHQAISKLASRFLPMAHAPDGLIEAYYDPHTYDPENAKFIVGLQFHPERMQHIPTALADQPPLYDYPGCPRPYQHFVTAATAYKRNRLSRLPSPRASLPSSALHNRVLNENTLQNRYSDDDLQRIIRSGGTVHGSTLILKMLQKENEARHVNITSCNDTNLDLCHPNARTRWKHFRRTIEQARRALQGLTDQRMIDDAHAMLQNLSDMCQSVIPQDSGSQRQKRLASRA